MTSLLWGATAMSIQADYHRDRVEQELAKAASASDKIIAKLHRELAKFHQLAAMRLDRPTLRIAIDD